MSVDPRKAAQATLKLIHERYSRPCNIMRCHGDGKGGLLHMQDMARSIRDSEVLFDRAQRWLGFMQGCAVEAGLATVEEFEDINRNADPDRVHNEIKAERQRQIDEEGWDAEHDDDAHEEGDLLAAALGYEAHALGTAAYSLCGKDAQPVPRNWPWSTLDWTGWRKTPRRNFVIAGALAMAENDRWLRMSVEPPAEPSALIQRCIQCIEEIDRHASSHT